MTNFPDENTIAALEAAPDAVIAADSRGVIRFANAKSERLTGYSPGELFGQKVEILVLASKRAAHRRYRSRFHSDPSQRDMDARGDLWLKRKDGVPVPVAISLSPLPNSGNGMVISTIRDVSDQERRSREDALIAEIAALAGKEHEIDIVYELLEGALPILFEYNRLTVSVNEPGTDLVERVYVSGDTTPEDGVGSRVLGPELSRISPGPLPSTSLAGSPEDKTDGGVRLADEGLQSWVEVPLGDPENPTGYLSLRSARPDAYDEADIALLERVASSVSPAFENARLYALVRREAHEKTVLAEISRIITSTSDIQTVYGLVANEIRKLVPFDRIVVSTADRSRNLVTDRYVAGTLVIGGGAGSTYALDDCLTGELLKDPRPRWSDEHQLELLAKRFPEVTARTEVGLRSAVTVPLIWDDKPIGILILRSKESCAYGEPEAQRAMKVASQISGAVANAELVQDLERENAVRNALFKIGRLLTTPNLDPVYGQLASLIAELIPHDRIVLSSFDMDRKLGTDRYVGGLDVPEGEVGRTFELPESWTSGAHPRLDFVEPRILSGDEHRAYARRNPDWQKRLDAGLLSVLACSLIWEGQPVGLLTLRSTDPDAFGARELDLVSRIANQIAGALANANLNERLKSHAAQQEAIAQIGRVVNTNLDVNAVYTAVADELERLIPYDRLEVVLFEAETEALTVDYFRGVALPGESLGDEIINPDRTRTWRWYLERGAKSGSTERDRRFAELGLQSWIQAPIGMQLSGPDGILSLRSRNLNQYSDIDAELLRKIAAQITPAIQNARLFEQSMKLSEQRMRAEALDEENIELQRVADARSEFLSTVSHELRTPLTAISAFFDILSRNRPDTLTNQQIDQIEVVKRSASSLVRLVDDLLDVSRADTGRLNIERAPFDIRSLICEFKADAVSMIDGKSQSLKTINVPEPVWIEADQRRIVQILSNLISNASKYSPPNTQIYLRVNVANGKLEIEVEDQGIGISSHDIANVFTPFFRAPNKETQHESGTGLGLSVVKTLVELHGGEIDLESEPGLGATVRFWIPGIILPPDQNSIGALES